MMFHYVDQYSIWLPYSTRGINHLVSLSQIRHYDRDYDDNNHYHITIFYYDNYENYHIIIFYYDNYDNSIH
ncbi:hypothetical protein ACHAPE_008950 [Trichoderma viride]